jgi:Ni/Co efflux regulator RcnB
MLGCMAVPEQEEHTVRTIAIALVSVLCAALISPASAQGQGQGKGQSEGHGKGQSQGQGQQGQGQGRQGQGRDNPSVERGAVTGHQGQQVGIVDRDRDAVRSWYRTEYAAGRCPPGLEKKNNGCLPPGQAKKMWTMGDPLPPQVVYYPIPRELFVQLTPPPYGYEYVRVDNDILLIATATRVISGLLGSLGSFD